MRTEPFPGARAGLMRLRKLRLPLACVTNKPERFTRELLQRTEFAGDSVNDVVAARAAGCPVWCVPYGYNEGRPAATLDCDRLVPDLDEAAQRIAGLSS